MRTLLGLLLISASLAAAEKPNVLLICVDDLKPVIACYGDPIAKTPNLDRLAARGTRFERAYCNQAVCSPSRNSLLTGYRPQSLGIYDLPTNFRVSKPDAVTLPEYFMAHGYRTEAMGKIFHVGHGNTDDAKSWSVPHFNPKAQQYAKAENKGEGKEARGAAYESADVADNFYGDGALADEASKRLAAKKGSTDPFFMAVGFIRPHLPFVAPKKYWDLYDAAMLPLPSVRKVPEGAPAYAPQFGGELRQYKGTPAKGDIPAGLERDLIHGYYAAVSYMDAQLGRVLDALDASGHAGDTIVVLWGDHGWHLGDHGMWCKHTNYEEAAHIPLIVVAPGCKPATSKAFVETVDLYPTLAALAGLPAPKLDGLSFAKTLADPAAPTKDWITHVYPRGDRLGRAIRSDRYRLVEWKRFGSAEAEYELYDYKKDPKETKNVAAGQPAVVAELKTILAKQPEAKPPVKKK